MPSREEAKNFYAQFIGDNEELRRQALPHRTTPIFNTDFSDYPEIENNKSKRADIDYIVEILLQELLLNKTHRQ